MALQIPPATDVLVAVFIAWAAGTALGAALTRLGGQVQPGHFKVMWLVATGMGAIAAIGFWPAWIFTALSLATFAAIYRRRDREMAVLTAAAAVAMLVAGGLMMPGGGWPLVGYGATAALLLGGVSNAMLLGHWHLNQPRLGTGPLRQLVRGLWVGLVTFIGASGILLARSLAVDEVAVVGAVTAIAFALFSAVLTAMVTHLVRIRSIMSATGILYLEVLLAFVCVFTGTLGVMSMGT